MNSLAILGIATALAAAATLRILWLDAARQRRRADRLAALVGRLQDERAVLLDELDEAVLVIDLYSAQLLHPSGKAEPALKVVR